MVLYDSSFGAAGKVLTFFDTIPSLIVSIVLQADGKIIAAGQTIVDAIWPYKNDLGLARYNIDGSLDSTFGIDGRLTNSQMSWGSCVALQPDEKIVIAGPSNDTSASYFALLRYNTDGTLDTAFGSGGLVLTDFGGNGAQANTLLIQTDGKIIAAGYFSNGADFDFALAQYNPDGSLDSTFGISGKITTAFGINDVINAITIQQDGKIIAAGYSSINARPPNQGGNDNDFAIARYLSIFNVGIVEFSLAENVLLYPNPIHSNEVLEYSLQQDETISINLYDMSGKLVKQLVTNENRRKGTHKESLHFGEDLSAGAYLLTITNGKGSESIKIVKQ